MTTLFDGTIDVDHGFLFLARDSDLADGFGREGQQNGLCGAGVAGHVSMTTGLQLGEVRVSIEWYADHPPVDDTWEEIVEVSYDVPATDLLLTAFEDHRELSVPATGAHRLRWSASGMDEADAVGLPEEGEEAPDRYLLQLWPAPFAPDQVIKQTSRQAAYWHGVARRTS